MDEIKKIDNAVIFIIQRPDGKILMQKRDDGNGQKIPYPNMWTIPGGCMEEKETRQETVSREIKEEYNLDIKPEDCELIALHDHDNTMEAPIFLCKVDQDAKPKLQEGSEMAWKTMEEIEDMTLAWECHKVIEEIKRKLK
jgi:8-oxo-dGTP diphosphatase